MNAQIKKEHLTRNRSKDVLFKQVLDGLVQILLTIAIF
jgi:hypothetical protein